MTNNATLPALVLFISCLIVPLVANAEALTNSELTAEFVSPSHVNSGSKASRPARRIFFLVHQAQKAISKYPLIFNDDFSAGSKHWQPTDPNAWEVAEKDENKTYNLHQQSKYEPPFRSPHNISLLKDHSVGNFDLQTRVVTTTRDYGHRSMCLFFGYQDPAHFYYVHLGQEADDHANQIFIVDGAARSKISTKTTPGTPWDDQWHDVRILRDTETGLIEIYWDDMEKPVMTAQDKTFLWGRVGLGSFDDTGNWDDFQLNGINADKK